MAPLRVATNTPPKPATAADNAKIESFVRGIDRPDVAAAGSEFRTAVMARPLALLCRLCTNTVSRPTMIIKAMRAGFSCRKLMPNSLGVFAR